jgi:MFS family permease
MESQSSAQAGSAEPRRLRGVALISVLVALMLTLLLEALDQTVVGIALPKIIGDLNGFSLYTWVATAYLLASGTVVPIVGKLSDFRRLARDYERLPQTVAGLTFLAFTCLMLHQLIHLPCSS